MKPFRFLFTVLAFLVTVMLCAQPVVAAESVLSELVSDVQAGELVDGADAFGPFHADVPAVQILKGGWMMMQRSSGCSWSNILSRLFSLAFQNRR